MNWDMWIDFHRIDENGLTLGSRKDARHGFTIRKGEYIVVGEDDSGDALAKVVDYEPRTGLVRLKVLSGSAASHPDLLRKSRKTLGISSRIAATQR